MFHRYKQKCGFTKFDLPHISYMSKTGLSWWTQPICQEAPSYYFIFSQCLPLHWKSVKHASIDWWWLLYFVGEMCYVVLHNGCLYVYKDEKQAKPDKAFSLFGYTQSVLSPAVCAMYHCYSTNTWVVLRQWQFDYFIPGGMQSTACVCACLCVCPLTKSREP